MKLVQYSTEAPSTQSIIASYGGDSTYTGSNLAATSVDVTLTAPITVQVMDNAGDAAAQLLTVTIQLQLKFTGAANNVRSAHFFWLFDFG